MSLEQWEHECFINPEFVKAYEKIGPYYRLVWLVVSNRWLATLVCWLHGPLIPVMFWLHKRGWLWPDEDFSKND